MPRLEALAVVLLLSVTGFLDHVNAACITAPSGLVGCWAGEGNPADWAGTNTGVAFGGAGYGAGKVGVAFAFANNASYIQIPDRPNLNFGASDFSIELWVNFSSLGGKPVLLSKDEGPGQTQKWIFWLNNNQLQFLKNDNGGESLATFGTFSPVVNFWYHIGLTRSNALFSLYVNGALHSTANGLGTIPLINAPVTLGQAENLYFLNGLEDEVSIYNRALTATEIAALYAADSGGKCAPQTAPFLLTQPQDRVIFQGEVASFDVLVAGTSPLSYQWRMNGTNISGATTNSLSLTNVQLDQSGAYSVVISNTSGLAVSSNGLLTVIDSLSCLPPPSGLIGWWAGEGNGADWAGTNNATLAGGASFVPGKVGVGFGLANGANYVQIPNHPKLEFGSGDFSIELWVQFAASSGNRVIIAKDEGPGNTHKWIYWLNNGQLQFLIGDGASQAPVNSTAFTPTVNRWYHLALTRSGVLFSFYVDGTLLSMASSSASIPPINAPLTIGQAENQYFILGVEDEISIYDRALSGAEISAIHDADFVGKCHGPSGPAFVSQPKSQAVFSGADVVLNVLATGAAPLRYQWRLNGTNISGATNGFLAMNQLQSAQSGSYSVVVSNAASTVISSNAILSVLEPGSCLPAPSGLIGWWPGDGNALGGTGSDNGTLAGSVDFTSGKVGGAFVLSASGSFVKIPDDPKFEFGTKDFSIELWAQFSSLSGSRTLIAKDEGPGATHKWLFWLSGGQLQLYVANGSAVTIIGSSPFSPALNRWYHLAITRNGSTFTFYIDGVLSGSVLNTVAIPPINSPLTLGQGENLNFLGGLEDEVSIYNRALSPGEIQSLFTANTQGKCTPPAAPAVVGQPQTQTVFGGANVTLSVAASGSRPMGYQWKLNGTNIPSEINPTAINSILTISGIQAAQAGSYTVTITNAVDSVLSANASISVLPPGACAPFASGSVGWWRSEGSTLDSAGANNGTLAGLAGFVPGKVGLAYSFALDSSFVQVPTNPGLTIGTNFTIELWAQFASSSGVRPLVAKSEGAGQTRKWIFWLNNGRLEFVVNDGSAETGAASAPVTPAINRWYHLAVTRDGLLVSFYVDGVLNSTVVSPISIPIISGPLTIGAVEGAYFMNGSEDEVSLYSRALTASEIGTIYMADSAGKCAAAAAPTLVSQPPSQTVFASSNLTLTVLAAGSAPLSYQWRSNGTNIAGATASSFTLTNIQPSQSGSYSVVVTNVLNSITSSNAVVTVLGSGSCIPTVSGITGWWAAEGNTTDGAGTNVLTLIGGAGYGPGKVGVAFDFRAGLKSAQGPNSPILAPGTNDFTIELWVQFTAANGGRPFVARSEGVGAHSKWIFWLNNGQLQFHLGSGGTQTALGSGNFSPATGRWYHVAVTRRGALFSFYVDGNLNSTAFSTLAIPAIAAPLTVGQVENVSYLDGLEDEVAIYNQALGAADIAAIYGADSVGKCRTATAPIVITQPQPLTVFAGTNASFSVLASGSAPLAYQWRFTGTNIPGATDPNLALTNSQPEQGGYYNVVVSNVMGSATSGLALLNVLTPGSCLPPPSGLVSWWSGDGNAQDRSGLNNGSLLGPGSYGPGKVGGAFVLTNGTSYVQVSDNPSLNFGGNDFTIELWVQIYALGQNRVLLSKDEGPGTTRKWLFWLTNGKLQFLFGDTLGQTEISAGFTPAVNRWYHLAISRSDSLFSFYVNGALYSTTVSTALVPPINAPLIFGQAENQYPLFGWLDEVAIYNRALTSTEIQGIYSADFAGKCAGPQAPIVITQPKDATVYTGSTTTLSVLAAGSAPLSYQWRMNGTNLPGAIDSLLGLTNIQVSQGGSYSVLVSNPVNFAVSSNAMITVLPPASCLPVPSGGAAWWRAEGNVADASGQNNGTLAGGATFAPGKVGLAFAFTNNTGYVPVIDNAALDFGANDFSIDLWVSFGSLGGTRAFIAKDEGPGATHKWIFWLTGGLWLTGGQLQFVIGNVGAGDVIGGGTFNPSPNVWYHLAVTRSGTLFSFYVNGNLNGSASSAMAVPAIGSPLTIGQAENLYFMGGLEDEITIYQRALSAVEVQAIYSADLAGKCTMPSAPSVVVQPQNQLTTFSGDNVTLNLLAAGSTPLAYQWRLNGTNLPGATDLSLLLTNVQPYQAGSYSVLITNSVGFVSSSNAVLSVYVPVCAPVTNNLIGWWTGEGSAADSSSTNHGALLNASGFAPGMVGSSFDFNGFFQCVDIPDAASLNPTNNLSIDAWVFPKAFGAEPSGIVKKAGGGGFSNRGYGLEMDGINGVLFAIYSTNGWIKTPSAPIPLNHWSHVAGVFDGTNLRLYVNGAPFGGPTPAPTPIVSSANHLQIGHDPSAFGRYFNGLIDEVSVYSTALSAGQIQSIYAAANVGKCPVLAAPSIAAQPQSLAAVAGSIATFNVVAAGSVPLSYQWRFNGTNIPVSLNPTADQAALMLGNVQASDAGSYSVLITNFLGSVSSANAALSVLFPPAITVQPVNQAAQLACAISFSGVATGTPPLFYQWQKNGTNMDGQASPVLTIGSVQSADFASYQLLVNNLYGSITSSVAVLSLNHPPTVGGTVVQRFVDGGIKIDINAVLAHASDADGDVLAVVSTDSASANGGTVALQGGTLYYTPLPGSSDPDAFIYTLSDSHCGGTANGIVLLLVRTEKGPGPSAKIVRANDGTVHVIFDGIPGQTYRIQSAASLVSSNWQDVATIRADQYGTYVFVEPNATNNPTRYFRSISP